MVLERKIVSLLMENRRLINTVLFRHEKYVGDPLNTIRIFSDFEVDELLLYDIGNFSLESSDISYIQKLCKYTRMPFTYGGGIRSLVQAEKLIRCGCDKVSVNSLFFADFGEVKRIINSVGCQSVSVSMNYYIENGRKIICNNALAPLNGTLRDYLRIASDLLVGEVVLNCVSSDGTLSNDGFYDFDEFERYPFSLVFLGGNNFQCGGIERDDGQRFYFAAGTYNFLHGVHRAVLLQR